MKVLRLLAFLAILMLVTSTSAAAGVSPGPSMHKARAFFSVAELLNGDVLVAGGFDVGAIFTGGPPIFPDAEVYDWHANAWRTVAPMHVGRAAAVPVVLHDGRVMVIGGVTATQTITNTVEIYDPRTDTWSFTGNLNDARFEDHTAFVIPGDRVFVAGGYTNGETALASAEIWDPRTGTWTRAESMHQPRGEFSSTMLDDGRILVAGGAPAEEAPPTNTAEIYDPRTGHWTVTASMSQTRFDHSSALLRDGRVLVAGGGTVTASGLVYTSTAEVYDPVTATWSSTGSMTTPHSEAEWASVLLPDGRFVVPGGFTAFDRPGANVDIYDPATGTWTSGGTLGSARAGHSGVLLRGNRGVLVIGGLVHPPFATATTDLIQ